MGTIELPASSLEKNRDACPQITAAVSVYSNKSAVVNDQDCSGVDLTANLQRILLSPPQTLQRI